MAILLVSFLFISTLSLTQSCIVHCPDDTELCVNEIWNTYLCRGFLGCVNQTTPCNGECHKGNPIIASDGQSCSPCSYRNERTQKNCQQCTVGRMGSHYWCKEEEKCKHKYRTCNKACPLPSYPIKIHGQCAQCKTGNIWCSEEEKCYNPYTQPCNRKCYKRSSLKYCSNNNTCVAPSKPCNIRGSKKFFGDAVVFPSWWFQ